MRYLVIFFILTTGTRSYPQYGQEGAILGAAEALIRSLELSELDKIADSQNRILTYHAAIAATTAEIVRVEQKLLDSESDLKPWVENLSSAIQVGITASQLADILQRTLDLAQQTPEMVPIVSEAMVNILFDASVIVQDFSIALKESPTNLLDNANRLEVLNVAQDGLDYLVGETMALYNGMRAISKLSTFSDYEFSTYSYDVTAPLSDIQSSIDNLIQE